MLKEVKAKLDAEIEQLDYELRVTLPAEIKKALEHGDLRENAEYKAALERQDIVKSRLSQLNNRVIELGRLDFSSLPEDRIAYGSTVEVENPETGEATTYKLVMPEESDIDRGWISVSSPIGRGLMGHEEGDEVRIQTPGGAKHWTITNVRTLHDESA